MVDEGADSRVFRRALVDKLWRDGHLHSLRVSAALEAVPREIFVPGLPLEEVYRSSEAIVTKRLEGVGVSSASAPEVIALMLEQLNPGPGDRVLEIGAGTGYNAALLAYLVGETGHVVTLDVDLDLVTDAREHLQQAGFGRVQVVQADGALGYPSEQAYDGIILTVASSDVAPAWRDQLARPHGRLVMPLALRGLQRCVAFAQADDCLVAASPRACSFIPLRGVLGFGSMRVPLDRDGARMLTGADEPLPLSPETITTLLKAPGRVLASGVSASLEEMREGLHLWLVAHQPSVCTLWGGSRVPDLFGLQDRVRGTLCIMDSKSESLVLLAWEDELERGGEVFIVTPAGAEPLAYRVQRLLQDWVAAGRPLDSDIEIRVYSRDRGAQPGDDEVAVDQRWSRFILRWRRPQPPASFTV
jgi:protein-L-isoaspartate(D-aspartate) O-methyltransferase